MAAAVAPLVGGLVTSLMGSDTPSTPEVKTAPTPDDKTSLAAKQRIMQRDYAKTGRLGTSLTSGDNKLG